MQTIFYPVIAVPADLMLDTMTLPLVAPTRGPRQDIDTPASG
jgi:hypothetical protein